MGQMAVRTRAWVQPQGVREEAAGHDGLLANRCSCQRQRATFLQGHLLRRSRRSAGESQTAQKEAARDLDASRGPQSGRQQKYLTSLSLE